MTSESPHSNSFSSQPFLAFKAAACDKRAGQRVEGIVSGLTLDGCLFQSPYLFALGTILRLEFSLSGRRIEISGVVRDSNPARSLRLEFFALDSRESLQYLQHWLAAKSIPPSPNQ